jgi:DNA-directed RNA polymerase specialized sigma24 family protein
VDVLTADELLAVVRVHADRVHDAVRRLGCAPEAALDVVEQSAHELVGAVAREPAGVGDPVGWWFARARALGRTAAGGDDALPMGGGVLSNDANQVRLAEALESRPERERAALLLRDSYDLPASAVGTVLGLDTEQAMAVVGAARLAFLPAIVGGAPLVPGDGPAGHADLAALARLAEGAQPDATARRHVRSCERCADLLDGQERARRMLSGLTVVALPDPEREGLLDRVEDRARRVLPAAVPTSDEEEWDEEPHRRYSISLMLLGLVAALGLGIGVGAWSSRGSATTATAIAAVPLVTPAPPISPAPFAATSGVPTLSPTPRVYVITPSPTPVPTATATPTPSATPSAQGLTLLLDPSSGPNDTTITVSGTGWTPGAAVTVQYLQRVGRSVGSSVTVAVDAQGTFTASLTAHDSGGFPGPHDVVADDGTHTTQATFTAT